MAPLCLKAFYSRGWQTTNPDQIQLTAYFHRTYRLKKVFTFLNNWKKLKKKNILWHVKVICDSNFSGYKLLLEHSQAYLSMAAFALSEQSWVVATETTWPKIFTIWPVTEKVFWPLSTYPWWVLRKAKLSSIILKKIN